MGIKILVIEDDERNAELIKRILERNNFTIMHTTTAEDGIAFAYDHDPNLILMDINLPGIDGLEATHIIKADPYLKHIPVVAVTGHRDIEEACYDAGCIGYILKPITVTKLLIAFQRYGF